MEAGGAPLKVYFILLHGTSVHSQAESSHQQSSVGKGSLTICASALAPSMVYFMQQGHTKSRSVSSAFSSDAFSSGYMDEYQV